MSGQFQYFLAELKETFWGELRHQNATGLDEIVSSAVGAGTRALFRITPYERSQDKGDARNGYYERNYVTRLGTLRLRVARGTDAEEEFVTAGDRPVQPARKKYCY